MFLQAYNVFIEILMPIFIWLEICHVPRCCNHYVSPAVDVYLLLIY